LPEPPQPVLVYDRVAANRSATRGLLALFTVLILPFVAGLIPLITPVIHFGVLLLALGEAAFDRIHSTAKGPCYIPVLGAVLSIVVATLVVNLSILDVISRDLLKETLGKTLSVIAVSTVALVLVIVLVKVSAKK